jgi:uncharacterized BrkB/YihY/UPF0761 family membrane protein
MTHWLDENRETIRMLLFVALAVFLVISLVLGVLGIVNIFHTREITSYSGFDDFGPDSLDQTITVFFILLMLSLASIIALYIAYRVTGADSGGQREKVAPVVEGGTLEASETSGNVS